MPIVTIEWWAGRSRAQKAEIAAKVTDLLAEVAEVEPEGVCVRFVDSRPEDWAYAGELKDADGRQGDGFAGRSDDRLGEQRGEDYLRQRSEEDR